MSSYPHILVIDFGSQTTLVIERTLREAGYRSVVLGPKRSRDWIRQRPVKCAILSGGLSSVYEENAPAPPAGIFDIPHPSGRGTVPVLGICYGQQWIAQALGGKVAPGRPEYGHALIEHVPCELFEGTPERDQQVWMSHGDSVMELPPSCTVLAREPSSGAISAFASNDRPIYGVQFHPEVPHTTHGSVILQNYVRSAGCTPDWVPSSMIEEIRENGLSQLKKGEEVELGVSGGVDSSFVGAVFAPALGSRLHGITIDAGNLRENELGEIEGNARAAGIPWRVIDMQDEFFTALEGIADAQLKRKAFQPQYSGAFQRVAAQNRAIKKLFQGTLAPDRIESGATGGAMIKQHHNVGLDTGSLGQIHPIDHLFKYEVRELAKAMGLPESIWKRQPFPGPGLFIRHIGPITRSGIETVRWADRRVYEILVAAGVYDELSQLIVAYFTTPTVGLQGDKRAYNGFVGVRAVKTSDFMTAEGFEFEPYLQREIKRAMTKRPEIVHTAFFPSDKPPATTEFE